MKKIIIYTIINLFLIVNFGIAQNIKTENCLLWKISGNGLQKASYIFGTIHIIPENEYFFYDNWQKKFDECEILIMEIDLNIGLKKQFSLLNDMKLPEDSTLKDYLSEKEFNNFNNYLLDSIKISKTNYDFCMNYKPFFSYSLILNEAIEGKKVSYEQNFTKLAKKRKMKIHALETIDFQISLVNDISIKQQINLFLYDFSSSKQTNLMTAFTETTELYKKQDLNSMIENEFDDEKYSGFYQNFLVKRNLDWIPKLEAFFKAKACFVAVGAAHLPGKDGILYLLKQKGYKVEPIFKN